MRTDRIFPSVNVKTALIKSNQLHPTETTAIEHIFTRWRHALSNYVGAINIYKSLLLLKQSLTKCNNITNLSKTNLELEAHSRLPNTSHSIQSFALFAAVLPQSTHLGVRVDLVGRKWYQSKSRPQILIRLLDTLTAYLAPFSTIHNVADKQSDGNKLHMLKHRQPLDDNITTYGLYRQCRSTLLILVP